MHYEKMWRAENLLQKLATVEPTYGKVKHYTTKKPSAFPEAHGVVPENAMPGQPLKIHDPDNTYATNVEVPAGTKPGDNFKVTWSVFPLHVTIRKPVGANEYFHVDYDGQRIPVINPKKKALSVGDTILMWFQKPNVSFTKPKQPKKEIKQQVFQQFRKELEMCQKELEMCKKALKAKEVELEKTKQEGGKCERKQEGGKCDEKRLADKEEELEKRTEELEKRTLEGRKCDEDLKAMMADDDGLMLRNRKAKNQKEMEASAIFIKEKRWLNPYRMMNVAGRTDVEFWKQMWNSYNDLGGEQRRDGSYVRAAGYAGPPPDFWKNPPKLYRK